MISYELIFVQGAFGCLNFRKGVDEGEGGPSLSANIGAFNMFGLKLEKMLLLNKFKCVQKCCIE